TDKSQLAVWCIDHKDDVFINDVSTEKFNYTKGKEDLWSADLEDGSESLEAEQSIMYVPIMSGKHVIGLITVQSFEKNAYKEQHLDILKNIAVYASIALINANVYRSLEERIELTKELKQQHSKLEQAYENNKILSEIGKDITSSLSVPEVIEKVYKNINSLMDASVFVIGFYNEKEKIIEFKGAMEKGKKLPSYTNDISDSSRPAVICLLKKKEIIINDRIKDYTRVLGQVPAPSVGDAPESIIYLPLISKKKTIGVISVQSFEKNAYTDYHIDILKNLAVYIPIALENALLYKDMEEKVKERTNEIEQSYRNTKLLAEISRDIASARSIESITEIVYERVNTLMDATGLAFGILNKDENRLDFPCDIEKGKKLPFNFDNLDDDSRLSIHCFKKQKEVVLNDFQKEYNKYIKGHKPPKPNIGEQSESIIYIPLTIKRKKIGVFTVQSFKKGVYSEYHVDIVRNLAVPVSTAIENALLYESLEEQVKERTRKVTEQHEQLEQSYKNTRILNEIGQDITASLSIKDVIQKVYKNINSLMDAAVFSIALFSRNKNVLIFEGGMENDKELPYYEVPLDDQDRLAVNCYINRREIIINEYQTDIKKYVSKSLPPRVGDFMESVIYLPLVSKDKTLGVFTVQSPRKNAYTEYHIDLLRNLAVYTPIALDNALMYGRMEKEVAHRTEEIQKSYQNTKMLSEIGLDIISALSVEQIADIVYKKANTLMDAASIALGIFNETKNTIDFVSEIENGKKLPFSCVSLDDENKLSTVCFKNQQEILINDFDVEYGKYIKEWYSAKTEDGGATQAIIYIPLTLKKKRIGVFTAQSFKKNVYTLYDLDILKNLGVAISTAIENATLYESLEEKVKERTNDLLKEKEKAEFEKEEARYQRRRAEQSEKFKQQFLANMSH
ncbi:MAG TPA: hypothetical protein DCX54_01040, partial [Flavobacteriales bacterium]|nr:hypothetical protein [Flavobacteriales bacterium]